MMSYTVPVKNITYHVHTSWFNNLDKYPDLHVTLRNGKILYMHQVVISEYPVLWKTLFNEKNNDSAATGPKKITIDDEDTEPDVLESLFEYCYGKVSVIDDPNFALMLLCAFDKYDFGADLVEKFGTVIVDTLRNKDAFLFLKTLDGFNFISKKLKARISRQIVTSLDIIPITDSHLDFTQEDMLHLIDYAKYDIHVLSSILRLILSWQDVQTRPRKKKKDNSGSVVVGSTVLLDALSKQLEKCDKRRDSDTEKLIYYHPTEVLTSGIFTATLIVSGCAWEVEITGTLIRLILRSVYMDMSITNISLRVTNIDKRPCYSVEIDCTKQSLSKYGHKNFITEPDDIGFDNNFHGTLEGTDGWSITMQVTCIDNLSSGTHTKLCWVSNFNEAISSDSESDDE